MVINGKEREMQQQVSLAELLGQEGFLEERVAVELNGEIIPKAAYGSTLVGGADRLEVVSFVGGG